MNQDSLGMTVGMVGVGDMGGAIARALLKANIEIVAFDLRTEFVDKLVRLGAHSASSIEDLARAVAIVSITVTNDEQLAQVVHSILRVDGSSVKTIVVHSTVLPRTVIVLGEAALACGIMLIDAPVTGGGEKAERGKLTVMIGGNTERITHCWRIFEAMGENLFRLGDVGSGQAMKLTVNALALGSLALTTEVMQFATAHGIDEDVATTVIAVSQADSRVIHTWGRHDRVRRTHNLAGTSAIYDLLAKDLHEAVVAGWQKDVDLPLIASAASLIKSKLMERDVMLNAENRYFQIPLCEQCGQELAKPFRALGLHPECKR